MQAMTNGTSERSLDRWARMALARMESALARYLGLDLLPNGAVKVHGLEEPKPTVGMIHPFGPIAHRVQLLRDDPSQVLEFYKIYSTAVSMMGRRSESFDGQVKAFMQAVDAVPPPVPKLRLVA
jgi:hypothetical protein